MTLSATPPATTTPTRLPATLAPPTVTLAPTPDFVAVALSVRAQMDNLAWQMHRLSPGLTGFRGSTRQYKLLGENGDLNCREVMNAYEFVQARSVLTVPEALAGPYQDYSAAVQHFLAGSEGLYLTCRNFLSAYAADPSTDSFITQLSWELALEAAQTARSQLTEAIVAAGGTP